MSYRPIRWFALLALAVLVAGPRTSFAEEAPAAEKKSDVVMDAGSKKLFDAWEQMHHHAGRAGAKKASVTWDANLTSTRGSMKGKASYVWDGKKGSAKWDNAGVGQTLSQVGWGENVLDSNFAEDAMMKTMKGLKLTAVPNESGTLVNAEGKSEGGYKSFQFDKDGLLTAMIIEKGEPPTAPTHITIAFRYAKTGDKYLMSGWDVKVPVPGIGEYAGTAVITWQKVGDYHVYAKAEVIGTMAGNPMDSTSLTWSDWKFNDDVKVSHDDDGCGCGDDDDGCEHGCGDDDDGCDDGCGEDDDGCGK